ncbi:chromatin structure-remodeling complex protein rsc1 [Patellaria atrata CBS 101060]|uniref:Chromatin structure-remodeling complex protein rsc1 n=1 Tax=Patellaria atrata CBS 101060 TaxID=1346257 RepID=A0A9P4VR67_9PEZI|nr:chromatin structure-remodeling complex protein rsc1 [Patellaria atrata CBS 101060]
MGSPRNSKSPEPIPSTETNQPETTSTLTDEQWRAMQTVLNNVYAHRLGDGYDPSKVFHRKVNKRAVPSYYEVIKEPMALSTIKAKLANKEYKSLAEFVRDFALIPHNAQVYNRPDAGAYQDALVIKEFLEKEFKKLVDDKIISEEDAKLPYLGEIPAQDEITEQEEEQEEEEEDDEEDEDDEEADDSDDDGKRKRRRGPRSTAAITKREGGGKEDAQKGNDAESRKKRGRPPRVDTPMEARIKAIMKAMRKPRNSLNQLMISSFERVPDKAAMPEYYAEIKTPMAMDVLKKKLKRKKYQSVDQFMKDVEQMFENAKTYNQDESQIYKDAVFLQKEARAAAEIEKKKPDTEYVMEEGRLPMPNGILHNGELWKVGDWVHIQNANDLTKPIVAQIYRTWQDVDGGKWVNACWYYRPEQTIHRFDRHFYENEVVKTGQYRDHPIEEVIDRCFVMFFTRYNKGRPRGFPSEKEIYVCEARYNEEKHKLNKIKTWASCLPDEVREKDYEMDLFDVPRKIKKIPSPIAYLLKDDAKETDDLPKPEWGAENAPPKIGAVHKRPRDPKESPPPEPTPTPPPQPPPPPPRQVSNTSQAPSGYVPDRPNYPMAGSPAQGSVPAATPLQAHPTPSYTPQLTQPFAPLPHHQSASPAPPHQQIPPAPSPTTFPPIPPHTGYGGQHHPQTPQHYAQPPANFGPTQPKPGPPAKYNIPLPVEVYHLNDQANASIPPEIREQFHRDDQGRVLFFTAPPIDVPPSKNGTALGHSVRYLAAKVKREELIHQKREREENDTKANAERIKRLKQESDAKLSIRLAELTSKAFITLESQMIEATKKKFQCLFPENWEEAMKEELDRLAAIQKESIHKDQLRAERERHETERNVVHLGGPGILG